MAGRRYEVLDGLRGTAALLVVALHLCGTFRPGAAANPLHHGYLAVDFFFMLSGFVVGHAYDGRWRKMRLGGFFVRRLIRLHPLVVLGAALGAAGYLITDVGLKGAPFWLRRFGENVVLAMLLLPAPGPPGLFGMTHALNPPAWSLTQEYLANIAYGLIGPRTGVRRLAILVGLFAAAELALAATHDGVDVGWGWSNLWLGPVRTAFPFFAGLLLQRSGLRLTAPVGWVGLSLVLLGAFVAPIPPAIGGFPANGLFEAVLVMAVFPLVIAIGAASEVGGVAARLCRLAGEISYPIYIVHAPLAHLYAGWVWTRHPPHRLALAVGAALGLALPLIAWLAFRLYDEPIRVRLSRAVGERRPPGDASVGQATEPAPTASPG